jgi:surface protein
VNNGIFGTPNFSVATDLVGIKPLLGIPQTVPTPYHFPQSYDFRIGNSDGISGKDFVFVVDTTILGSTTISIPLKGVAGSIQSISWGDGTFGAITSGSMQRVGSFETLFVFTGTTVTTITHTYSKHGVYTIVLRGLLILNYGDNIPSATAFLSYGDSSYGASIISHGGSPNTVYVPPQIPRAVTTMQACFQNNLRFNHPNVGSWDVSNITNMQQTFAGATAFNQDLDLWANKVSGVTNFSSTFSLARAFDGSVSNWVLGGANCAGMFFQATNFTGKGIQSWSVGNVTNMSNMFFDCTRLNVSGDWNWDTKNVTSTSQMFYGVPLNNVTFSGWDLSKSNCFEMFRVANINNCSFPNWIVNNATSMFTLGTVNNCTLSGWRITSTAASMFSSATTNNLYIPSWSLSGSAASMFFGSNGTKSGLNDWNVSGVTNMSSMFQYGSDFMVADLSNWDIRNVTTFQFFMLRGLSTNPSGSITINNWKIPSGAILTGMFGDPAANKFASLSGWSFGGNSAANMFRTYNFTAAATTFNNDLTTWDTSGITSTASMFFNNASFRGTGVNGDLRNWNTSNITDMSNMFNTCQSLITSVSGWDTSKVTNMSGLFYDTRSWHGSGLETWNTSNVTNMSNMFQMIGGRGPNANLSGWDTGRVTNMSNMFSSTNNFIHNFAGSGIDNWNVTGVTTVNSMFRSNAALNTTLRCNLSGWNLCSCTDMTNFMQQCNIGSGNYDILLNSWAVTSTGNPIKPWATGINVHFGTVKYTAASSGARQRLVNYGWTITDGGFQA